MQIYNEITNRIDKFYEDCKNKNPFFIKIHTGQLKPEVLERYLNDIRSVVSFTPEHCSIGLQVSKSHNWHSLADFYKLKLEEEVGHDQWGDDDIRHLRSLFNIASNKNIKISKQMQKILEYNKRIVEKDPRLYLVYILFSEYFTVIAAEESLESLEKRCGIPRNCMSIIEKHASLDKEHVSEWKELVKKCEVNFNEIHGQALDALDDFFQNYEDFLTGIAS